ncbi:hypothetical protein M9Y10_029061 [Tritrichomonas musculus]|uniref:Uncharacterized protein n=1 Tax=Tritrichomonas musculus TaxID=1915356 RepID=A0ABR2KL41_9EUKA
MFNFANSVSRTSRTSSRAKSSIFNEAGDIEMDFFSRQVKRLETSMSATEEKKADLLKQYTIEKQSYKSLKERVKRLRNIINNRQNEANERLKKIKEFQMTEEGENEANKAALEKKEEIESHLNSMNKSLQTQYSQINDVVEKTTSIPDENPEYAPLFASTGALKKAAENRKNVINNGENEKRKMNDEIEQINKEEKEINYKLKDLNKSIDALEERVKKALTILAEPDDSYSLTNLEKLVDRLETLANSTEMRFTFLSKEKMPEDFRTELVEIEHKAAANFKRRHLLSSQYESVQRQIKEIQHAIKVRKGIARDISDATLIAKSKRTPEEVETIISDRSNDLISKYKQLSEEIANLDQLEFQNCLERDKVENEWKAKMKKIEKMRIDNLTDDQTLIKINQLTEAIDVDKQQREINASKIQTLQRRAQNASQEREKSLNSKPEINFAKERVEEKSKNVHERQISIDQRKNDVHLRSIEQDKLDQEYLDLMKRTIELEKLREEKGLEVEKAKEKMMHEQELLDQVLAKIPLDQKIQILQKL